MGKKKNTENTDCVCENVCKDVCEGTNREPTPYEELEWRVKDFVNATSELIDVQESLIRDERRYATAKEGFDFYLKWLRDTMKNQKV